MRLRPLSSVALLFLASLGVANGQLAPDPATVSRGAIQTIKTINGPWPELRQSIDQKNPNIALRPVGRAGDDIPVALRTNTDDGFSFVVVSSAEAPDYNGAVPFGSYDLVFKDSHGKDMLLTDANKKEIDARLKTFIKVEPGVVSLKAAESIDPYPEKGKYTISMQGEGFSEIPFENTVILNKPEGTALIPDSQALVACDPKHKGLPEGCLAGLQTHVGAGGRELTVSGIPGADYGSHKVQVLVSGKAPQDDHSNNNDTVVTLSWVPEWVPAIVAIAGFAVLVLIVYAMVSTGLRKLAAAQELQGILSMLFFEPETNSFSLSKLQFYLWTGSAILGYGYLTAAKSLAQGDFAWGDIPSGLPAIILFSSGTTVAATGVTAAKGSKGAGDPGPNLSDFITTGGIVAPERVQFLVWTLVGVSSFLMLVFLRSPVSIHDLPSVPSGFLQLMGISAAGYIGGKLVRQAGPKIASIDATFDPAASLLALNISGGVLSQSGSFEIDGKQVSASSIVNPIDPNRPKPGAKDTTVNDPDLFQSLELTIQDPDNSWLTPGVDHNLTIYNPGGEKAVWRYQVSPAKTLTAATMAPAPAGAASHVAVTAPGFAATDKFEYQPAAGGASTVVASATAIPSKPYVFDVVTGAASGTNVTVKITRPSSAGNTGSSAVSNAVTV